MKIRGTSPLIKETPVETKTPITGAGVGAPDEVKMMDEIIKSVR